MKIADIRATPVSVPLAAPLRHANGCHWGRFVRTIVEVETDDGRVGLGELGGGGEAATAAALPGDSFRFDPNGVWSTEVAVWFGRQIENLDNDYLEDPVFGLHGMRRARERIRIPLATNTVVVGFEQLAANVLQPAVDVILLDTTFWGGIRPCVKAAGICEAFQLGVAVHSSGELGIQLAPMLHLGAVIPNLTFP